MSFFRRRKGDDQPSGEPAASPALPDIPDVIVGQLAAQVSAQLGRPGTLGDGVITFADGSSMGLHNLKLKLADADPGDWPAITRAHVESLHQAREFDQEAPVDPASVLVKLRLRADLGSDPDYPAREPLPGVLALLAVDTPTAVLELRGSLTPVGSDAQAAYARALANLEALPQPELITLHANDEPTSAIHLLVSEDFFGAARLLVLPSVLRRALGVEIPPDGVLVAVPNRHLIVVHVPTDSQTLDALQSMTQFVLNDFQSRPGPISPDVYHLLPDGRAVPVTRTVEHEDGTQTTTIHISGQAFDLFRGLGLIED